LTDEQILEATVTTPENPNPEQPEEPEPSSAEQPPHYGQPPQPPDPTPPAPPPPAGQDEALGRHEQQPRIDAAGNPTAHAAVPPLSDYSQPGPAQGQGQAQPQDPWQAPGQPVFANSHQPGHDQQQQQPNYGQQQQPGYGYPPPPSDYGAPYGSRAERPAGMPPYAGWGQRAVAWLIDNLVAAIGLDLLEASYYDWGNGVRILSWVLAILGVIWSVYNAYLAGQTGQSTGKRMMHIRLARFVDGQVVGGGYGILRLFMNAVFWVVCLIPGLLNYLWPLWDPKSQTWSDKIASSVVVKTQ
jgi:uncharacterized RDD family membrane protein YckC